jgi:hypothetical protein
MVLEGLRDATRGFNVVSTAAAAVSLAMAVHSTANKHQKAQRVGKRRQQQRPKLGMQTPQAHRSRRAQLLVHCAAIDSTA